MRTASPYSRATHIQNKNTNIVLAENYYTADYPDDEVDSDDEYDRMAYHYRTGNASDLEEFDEREGNDDLDSDDENGETRTSASAHLGFKPPKRFMSREGF